RKYSNQLKSTRYPTQSKYFDKIYYKKLKKEVLNKYRSKK
ncbi:hypothetical protein DOY81_002834, partial [Sarcophaga bullata]